MKYFIISLYFISMFAVVIPAHADTIQTIPDLKKTTLKQTQDRGYVTCGVTSRMPGLSSQGLDGRWVGFNVDFCRALAAAVIGNSDAIQAADYWLDALRGNKVDVIHAGATWTFNRDTKQKVDFTGINFYEGQGFIAYAKMGAHNLTEAMNLKGVKVCAIGPTSTALVNLQDFLVKNKVDWSIVTIQTIDGMWRAFFGGRCDMVVHDRTALAGVHAERLDGSKDFVVFPEVISKEPLSPAVREDDPVWRDLVSWVTNVTIVAEELGVTQNNVDDMKAHSKSPEIRRLLGVEKGLGKGFGLDDEWAYRIIKQVGNYADIFDRNLGKNSDLKLSRGLNELWVNGGLLYSPPIR